ARRWRTQPHPAACPMPAPRPPSGGLAAEGDHPAGLVVSDLAEVADLDPGRGNPALAPHLELLLVDLADGRRAGVDAAGDRDAANRQPRPYPGDDEQKAQGVTEHERRADPGQVREEHEQ